MKYHSEFTKQYVEDICNALNEAGQVKNNRTGEPFKPENFRTLTVFLQGYVVSSADYFHYLDDMGLVNRGRCPYTGQRIDDSFPSWSYMNKRRVYVSHEGIKIMKIEDDEEYERVMGRPPKKESEINTQSNGCYIATACYGNEKAPEVIKLKLYRDKVLKKKITGRIFIKFYYFVSPTIAIWLKNQTRLNFLIKEKILNPFIDKISKS